MQISVSALWKLGPFCDWIKDVAWYFADDDDTVVTTVFVFDNMYLKYFYLEALRYIACILAQFLGDVGVERRLLHQLATNLEGLSSA